mmetsp:Transcript_6377/g.20425  ORF Transcript_6377/g.20425 Transcript_6377/m.20425 type:complete len:353 (+) Transcript_6377:37-1095(+)
MLITNTHTTGAVAAEIDRERDISRRRRAGPSLASQQLIVPVPTGRLRPGQAGRLARRRAALLVGRRPVPPVQLLPHLSLREPSADGEQQEERHRAAQVRVVDEVGKEGVGVAGEGRKVGLVPEEGLVARLLVDEEELDVAPRRHPRADDGRHVQPEGVPDHQHHDRPDHRQQHPDGALHLGPRGRGLHLEQPVRGVPGDLPEEEPQRDVQPLPEGEHPHADQQPREQRRRLERLAAHPRVCGARQEDVVEEQRAADADQRTQQEGHRPGQVDAQEGEQESAKHHGRLCTQRGDAVLRPQHLVDCAEQLVWLVVAKAEPRRDAVVVAVPDARFAELGRRRAQVLHHGTRHALG